MFTFVLKSTTYVIKQIVLWAGFSLIIIKDQCFKNLDHKKQTTIAIIFTCYSQLYLGTIFNFIYVQIFRWIP